MRTSFMVQIIGGKIHPQRNQLCLNYIWDKRESSFCAIITFISLWSAVACIEIKWHCYLYKACFVWAFVCSIYFVKCLFLVCFEGFVMECLLWTILWSVCCGVCRGSPLLMAHVFTFATSLPLLVEVRCVAQQVAGEHLLNTSLQQQNLSCSALAAV